MKELDKFKEIFWDAFHKPKLVSEKFYKVWESLEHVNNMLAGPFYSIYSSGNCEYVFTDKSKFPRIDNPDDFLDYCTHFANVYKEKIEGTEVVNEDEQSDKQLLLYQTDIKMELAHLAYSIVKINTNLPDRE